MTYTSTHSLQGVREGTMDGIFISQTLGTGLKGMCKNLAGSDWLLVLAHHCRLLAELVLNIADRRICYEMAGFNNLFFSKKCHFIDKNFTVIFM